MQTYNFENETDKELKIKKYISCYLDELQRHFDMPDKKMRTILYKIYKESCPISKFKSLIKKYFYMVKSFYRKNKD
ncbi:MAG: hypothetical protein IJ877_00245 [Candidatus Gastranaerophilales bacterium]|nr:hypothetical protein [Candidatus Gastranaerophilales bacterium]